MQNKQLDIVEVLLFVAGDSPRSLKAIENFKKLQNTFPDPNAKFSIVDIFKEPQLAEQYRVLATPTLVRVFPLPTFRLIGDFSDPEQLIRHLKLNP